MAFEFVLTTEEIREKIFDFFTPEYLKKHRYFDVNWTEGVYDKENDIFLTMIDYESGFLTRCGEFFKFIVIMNNSETFSVDDYTFKIPEKYEKFSEKVREGFSEKVREGVDFYENGVFIDDFYDTIKEKSEELDRISKTMDEKLRRKRDLTLNKYNS